jgi:hypothetical protein
MNQGIKLRVLQQVVVIARHRFDFQIPLNDVPPPECSIGGVKLRLLGFKEDRVAGVASRIVSRNSSQERLFDGQRTPMRQRGKLLNPAANLKE